MLSPIQCPALSALEGIRHGFFTREGGVSVGCAYSSLNCSLSQDSRSLVLENRRLVAQHLRSRADDLLVPQLCHSADVVLINSSSFDPSTVIADGIVTTERGLAIGVLSADCAPVLLADPHAGVVAAVHAGWRGALQGVVENTIAVMKSSGALEERIVAAVGPCIRQDRYEVGPEFESQFLAKAPWTSTLFSVPSGKRKAHFNLPGFVVAVLKRLGVYDCSDLQLCTWEDERFFSYRRHTARGITGFGCQATAILLE